MLILGAVQCKTASINITIMTRTLMRSIYNDIDFCRMIPELQRIDRDKYAVYDGKTKRSWSCFSVYDREKKSLHWCVRVICIPGFQYLCVFMYLSKDKSSHMWNDCFILFLIIVQFMWKMQNWPTQFCIDTRQSFWPSYMSHNKYVTMCWL